MRAASGWSRGRVAAGDRGRSGAAVLARRAPGALRAKPEKGGGGGARADTTTTSTKAKEHAAAAAAAASSSSSSSEEAGEAVAKAEAAGTLPLTAPWLALDSVWEANEKVATKQGTCVALLTPGWKLLLLSVGTMTRHLQLLTDAREIKRELLQMNLVGSPLGAPQPVELMQGEPILQRQVMLRNTDGDPLTYVTTWWRAREMQEYVDADSIKEVLLQEYLAETRTEVFRQVERVYLGFNKELDKLFGSPGPFWGRYYTFWKDERPLICVYEVFSPSLEKYVGSSMPRGFDEAVFRNDQSADPSPTK